MPPGKKRKSYWGSRGSRDRRKKQDAKLIKETILAPGRERGKHPLMGQRQRNATEPGRPRHKRRKAGHAWNVLRGAASTQRQGPFRERLREALGVAQIPRRRGKTEPTRDQGKNSFQGHRACPQEVEERAALGVREGRLQGREGGKHAHTNHS